MSTAAAADAPLSPTPPAEPRRSQPRKTAGSAVVSTTTSTHTSAFTSGRRYDSAASAEKLPYSQQQVGETVSQRVAKLSAEDFSGDFAALSIEAIPRLKRIFDALALEMPVSAGKRASTEERNQAKNRKSTLVYGEISFESYAIAIEKIKNKYGGLQMPGGVFYDLGHGTGKPSLAAALLHDFDSVNGIEILESLYTLSMRLRSVWMENIHPLLSAAKRRTEVNFFLGDITVEDWSDATLCFANSTCFDDILMRAIADKADLMARGTFFITFTKRLPSDAWEVLEYESHQMSWGSATVYIQRKL